MRIIPFLVGLLSCLVANELSADARPIRVKITASGDNGDDARMVSALSREFRKLDRILITDTPPTLGITCAVLKLNGGDGISVGYASSVAVTDDDHRLITHLVQTASTIDALAHEIAIKLDGTIIEPIRRATQPSSSP